MREDAIIEERLRQAGCVAAAEERHELRAAARDGAHLEQLLSRREQGEPLAWITGSIAFAGAIVLVDQDVYVPRLQSEELARRASRLLDRAKAPRRAADLCTGAGALARYLGLAVPDAQIVGVDIDERAVRCARRNGVCALVGNLADPLTPGAFDVVTAIAPYVPTTQISFLPPDVVKYEPRGALDGGEDGLDVVTALLGSASEILRPGGSLLLEIGGDQAESVWSSLEARGYGHVEIWSDEEGDLRGIMARWTPS